MTNQNLPIIIIVYKDINRITSLIQDTEVIHIVTYKNETVSKLISVQFWIITFWFNILHSLYNFILNVQLQMYHTLPVKYLTPYILVFWVYWFNLCNVTVFKSKNIWIYRFRLTIEVKTVRLFLCQPLKFSESGIFLTF